MDDLRKGLEVGPYTLIERHHLQPDCQIWKAHHPNGYLIALKFRKQSLMMTELAAVFHLLGNDVLPRALAIPGHTDGANMCGFYKTLAWIAERFCPYTLSTAPAELVEAHWRTILTDCLYDLQCMKLMMHCDIKADNILVDTDGHAALIDFELCRNVYDAIYGEKWVEFVEENQRYYNFLGAIPEQRLGPRFDLEALGIALGMRLMGYNQNKILCHTDTSEIRDWETFQAYIHPNLHPYMEALHTIEWDDLLPRGFLDSLLWKMSAEPAAEAPVQTPA